MNHTNAVQIQQVSQSFGKRNVLHEISMEIPRSQICGLLGPSGAGKSTLVKIIAGIDTASKGSIQVFDQTMPSLAVMQRIGYMAQSDALYQELTARDNLQFVGSLYGMSGKRLQQRIHAVMELVQLSNDLQKRVQLYSGGMKRRLSLAAALLHEPEMLILDEPTVGIDPLLRQSIWNELRNLSENGTTIILTTHVMDEADKCQKLGLIREGRLIAFDTPEAIKLQTGTSTIEDAFLIFGGARS